MSLTQQENNKIKERDEQHTQELRVWRADLAKTKQVSWAAWMLVGGKSLFFPTVAGSHQCLFKIECML